jgi:hypothetical protein
MEQIDSFYHIKWMKEYTLLHSLFNDIYRFHKKHYRRYLNLLLIDMFDSFVGIACHLNGTFDHTIDLYICDQGYLYLCEKGDGIVLQSPRLENTASLLRHTNMFHEARDPSSHDADCLFRGDVTIWINALSHFKVYIETEMKKEMIL